MLEFPVEFQFNPSVDKTMGVVTCGFCSLDEGLKLEQQIEAFVERIRRFFGKFDRLRGSHWCDRSQS